MLTLEQISEVNPSYIHLNINGQQSSVKTNSISSDDLKELYNDCVMEQNFYSRMSKELSKIIEQNFETLNKTHCPSQVEIDTAGNILDRINLEIKQTQYIAKANENSGIILVNDMARDSYYKYEKLRRQILHAMKELYC